MKRAIYIFILSCCISSCYMTQEINEETLYKFTYKYDGKYTGIDTLININGYYQQTSLENHTTFYGFAKPPTHSIDTFYYFLMFYDNGLCRINFIDFATNYDDNGKYIDRPEDTPPRNMPLFFRKVTENPTAKFSQSFYSDWWGIYRVSSDTITIQALHESFSLNDNWYMLTRYYKILDKNTILQLEPKSWQLEVFPAVFMPISEIPSSQYASFLKYRWFWQDETEWMKYMEEFGKWHKVKQEQYK